MMENKIDKIKNALRAFFAKYRFKPITPGPQPFLNKDYIFTFEIIHTEKNGKTLQLQLSRQEHDHLINLLQGYYPNQLDKSKLSSELLKICKEWIENDYELDDDNTIEDITINLLKTIESSISELLILIPIDGLIIDTQESIELARSIIKTNHKNSTLNIAVTNLEEKHKDFTNLEVFKDSPSFAECRTYAQSTRAVDIAVNMVNQSLDILRLYLGSYYFDVHSKSSSQTRMGISRSFASEDRSHAIILDAHKDYAEQIPGSSTNIIIDDKYRITQEILDFMDKFSLQKINSLFDNPDTKAKEHISRRLLRSINWFAKATTAKNLADSFIFYAISIEALLSEGRTPQHTYSDWIAALVSQDEKIKIYPMDGARSKEFSNNLNKAESVSKRYKVVKDRCMELFDYRNNIAHGAILDKNIDPVALLDLETITRNSILSFLQGSWKTFNDFKNWYYKSTWTEFVPQ